MNEFYCLLNPIPKKNLTFVLAHAFLDQAGQPLKWQLRQMNDREQVWFSRQGNEPRALFHMIATTLVYPRLDDKLLLTALSAKCKKPISSAADALEALLTYDEMRVLKTLFEHHNGLDVPFLKRVSQFSKIFENKADMRVRLAHLALQNHHISPKAYFEMTEQEKAFMAASDFVCQKELKKVQRKLAAPVHR